MSFKEFIKPTIVKIILFVVLFGFFSYFFGNPYLFAFCDPCGCYDTWGSPLHFAEESAVGGVFAGQEFSCGTRITNFRFWYLITDIIFWFLLSCLIVFAYNKVKSKR